MPTFTFIRAHMEWDSVAGNTVNTTTRVQSHTKRELLAVLATRKRNFLRSPMLGKYCTIQYATASFTSATIPILWVAYQKIPLGGALSTEPENAGAILAVISM